MKNVIIFILACLLIYVGFWYKAPVINTVETVTPEMKELADAEVKRVESIIDKKGFEHAVTDEVENTVGDISKVRDSARKEIDSILSLREIDAKQLKEWKQYAVAWKDSFIVAKKTNDSTFRYVGNSLDIEFVNKKDTPYFNYKYDAKVNYLSYWERKHFLAPKRHYIDFWIEDTRATINGVKRIKIQQIDKPIFEINAVGRYDIRPLGGGEAYYKKGRLGVGIGYLYDFERKEWIPSLNTKFNILEF